MKYISILLLFLFILPAAKSETLYGTGGSLTRSPGLSDRPHLSLTAKIAAQNQTSYFSCQGSHDSRPPLKPGETGGQPGSIACSWSFGDGANSSGTEVTHRYTGSGQVNIVLTGCFTTSPFTCTTQNAVATINNDNSYELIADPRGPYYKTAGETVNFSAEPQSGFFEPDYKWNFGDGNTKKGRKVTHIYNNPGIYTVKVTVSPSWFSAGSKSEGFTTAEISARPPAPPENQPPVPKLADFGKAFSGVAVLLDGSKSYDPEGTLNLTYKWRFGDSTKEEVTASSKVYHAYAKAGSYTVALIVSDGDKEASPISKTIVVEQSNLSSMINGGGKCLDIHATHYNSKTNGGIIQGWECTGGANQSWHLTNSGELKSKNGMCLDVHATDYNNRVNGAKVQQWPCNGAQNQKWTYANNRLQSKNGKCLDIHAPDLRNNGSRVQLWDCSNSIQQEWTFASDFSPIVNNGGNLCLDINVSDLRINGGKVQVWSCNGKIQQKWRMMKDRTIVNAGGKCLDVHATDYNNRKSGGKVQVWDCKGNANQRWKISGDYLISDNNMCLDVHAPDMSKNGAKVQMWQCNGGIQQKWSY